jgi:Uma2 family endonuclease
MQTADPHYELVAVPLSGVTLPLPIPVPAGFASDRLDTWPDVEGKLEYVEGRLLYTPPSGDLQQDTCADVIGVLKVWRRSQRHFVIGANEAGIRLGDETRAADVAVWETSALSDYDGRLRRAAPLLAVEVAGKFDTPGALRDKARWYLSHGSAVVWLLFPLPRQVIVVTSAGETTHELGERLPLRAELPNLEPLVDELFEQVTEK